MNIALIGYGKMGKAIEQIAIATGHTISVKIDATSDLYKQKDELQRSDVAIEFTQPESAYQNILTCFDLDIPVVCGTTGWLEKMPLVKKICLDKNKSFFYASNYSIGVNIFFEINKLLAEIMNKHSSYDRILLEENHHLMKLDAPSGTAITIAEQMLSRIDRLKSWTAFDAADREDNHRKQNPADLPIYSVREADVPGTHCVKYLSAEDEIEIIHKAHNRTGFAKGALTVALWLVGKKGFYGMEDLLSL